MTQEIIEKTNALRAIIAKNEGKHLLNFGELRELTKAQNELLLAMSSVVVAQATV